VTSLSVSHLTQQRLNRGAVRNVTRPPTDVVEHCLVWDPERLIECGGNIVGRGRLVGDFGRVFVGSANDRAFDNPAAGP